MRPLLVAALALAGLLATGGTAAASCRQLSVAEQVKLAPIVAYGTIDQDVDLMGPFPTRTVTFRTQRVLKGALPAIAQVRIGPDIPGGRGATSVDYVARRGAHVLYLRPAGNGYETDQCSGSHVGGPTAEETALLGMGSAPPAASLGDEIAALDVRPFVLVGVIVALALAALLMMRRRYTSMREGRISV